MRDFFYCIYGVQTTLGQLVDWLPVFTEAEQQKLKKFIPTLPGYDPKAIDDERFDECFEDDDVSASNLKFIVYEVPHDLKDDDEDIADQACFVGIEIDSIEFLGPKSGGAILSTLKVSKIAPVMEKYKELLASHPKLQGFESDIQIVPADCHCCS